MKVCVYTLGCKVNQYESGAIAGSLAARGCEVTDRLECADVYVVNTCAVTNEAERKSRQIVSRCEKLNPGAKIVVCGCSSQHDSESFWKEGRLVIGTADKSRLADKLEQEGILTAPVPGIYEDGMLSQSERVRASVKVQDGCDNFCSYCIVPYLRGRSRSRQIPEVLKEIAVHEGKVQEFVITGVNLSDYGRHEGESLTTLMNALKNVNAGIRLGSLEVNVIDDAFLTALTELKRFCPQFHLSLQSGCDSVLKRMNRKYGTAEFLEKVELIRRYFPDAGITTDVIAGFPEETEEEHCESARFLRRAAFSDIHVFRYSVREGTAAAKRKQVPQTVAKRRTEALLELKAELKAAFIRKQLGKKQLMLTEESEGGYLAGYTENYVRCYLPAVGHAENELLTVSGMQPYLDGMIVKID